MCVYMCIYLFLLSYIYNNGKDTKNMKKCREGYMARIEREKGRRNIVIIN